MRWRTMGSVFVLTVALSGFGGFAWAEEAPEQPMMGPQMMGPGHGMMGGAGAVAERPLITFMLQHKEELGLSADQVRSLEGIRSDFQKEATERMAEIEAAEAELQRLLEQAPVDLTKVEETLRRIEALRTALRLGRIKAIEQGKTLLSAEQQKTLQALLEKGGKPPMMRGRGMMQGGMMGPGMMQPCMGGQAMGEQAPGAQASETRINEERGVTVTATYRGLIEDGKLGFDVKLDTHSGSLDGYVIERLAYLRNDAGQVAEPVGWHAAEGSSHHRSGLLLFPTIDRAGNPLISEDTRSLELVVKDLAGVPERVLKWDLR